MAGMNVQVYVGMSKTWMSDMTMTSLCSCWLELTLSPTLESPAPAAGDMPPKHTSLESPRAQTLWKYLGGGTCPRVSSLHHTRVVRSSAYISLVSWGRERERMRPPKT